MRRSLLIIATVATCTGAFVASQGARSSPAAPSVARSQLADAVCALQGTGASSRVQGQQQRRGRSAATQPSTTWELDFYSRPVQGADGKKLWELLVTDDARCFRHVEAVPSNCVNSRELRSRVQRLIDDAEVPPSNIRFFRSQMKNMISIALNELPGVSCKASRVTYALYDWLEERERDVYPTMAGYRKPRPEVAGLKLPVKLPEQLRGEQYAVATLPLSEILPGGSITDENIGFGSLCPLPNLDEGVAADSMVAGVVIFSRRSRAIAAWLTGLDLAFVSAVLESREIFIEVGLDTQYLLARMRTPTQTLEAETFEQSKTRLRGLHFLSVQSGPEAEQPDGFWLLRDIEAASKGRTP
jgi:hypothetical protein